MPLLFYKFKAGPERRFADFHKNWDLMAAGELCGWWSFRQRQFEREKIVRIAKKVDTVSLPRSPVSTLQT
jgi:hypothetical protein